MIRVALLFLVAIAIFVALRMILGRANLSNKQFGLIYCAVIAGFILLFLGLTGRAPWLFSILGGFLLLIARSLPLIMNFMDIGKLASKLRGALGGVGGTGNAATGQQSTINTRYFRMTLDHDSGTMDGEILHSSFQNKFLSDLDLNQLKELVRLCQDDNDSINVLHAYLDRTYSEWRGSENAKSETNSGSMSLSIREAYEILGLEEGVGSKEVREAHRRLIQKVHPDHGGSGYLAARINEAKTVLLDHLGK